MKKRFLSMLMVMVIICAMAASTAQATTLPNSNATRAAVFLSSSLDKVSGTTYKMWAEASVPFSESLYVYVSIEKKVGSSYSFVDSASASGNTTRLKASKNISLSAGEYRLYSYASGNTNTTSFYTYYTIK